MPQQYSRVHNVTETAASLIDYLNAKRGQSYGTAFDGTIREERVDSRALVVLIRRLQALENLVSSNIEEIEKGPAVVFSKRPLTGRETEIHKLVNSINRFLKRYVARPILSGSTGSPLLDWNLAWVSRESRIKTLELVQIQAIVELASSGRIFALKQCENCQRWLFAKFSHQRFCSGECKDEFHKTNEADKKRRRDWARENYWIRKHKNVK